MLLEEQKKIIEENEYVLIKYDSDYSESSRLLETRNLYIMIKNKYRGKIINIEYKIEKDTNIFELNEISTVPTFVLYKNGKLLYNKIGNKGIKELVKLIAEEIN